MSYIGDKKDDSKVVSGKNEGFKIQEAQEIVFGKAEVAADNNLALMYWLMSYRATGNIETTSTHPVVALLELIGDAVDAIVGKNTDFANATATAEQVFMNLGRLARYDLNGDQFIEHVQELETYLSKKSTGVNATTKDNAQCVCQCWWVIGQGMDELFGQWNTTGYSLEDDAWAGIWIAFHMVVRLWNWQVGTYLKLVHSIGDFTTKNGFVEGRFKQFDEQDQKTWGAVLMSEFNSTTTDIFGLVKEMVTDERYRGIKVLLLEGTQESLNKLFSDASFIWRYERWFKVIPLYTIWSKVDTITDSLDIADYHNGDTEGLQLFKNYTNTKWAWFNETINKLFARLDRFQFKGSNGSNFGALKSRFKLVPFFEFPTPEDGQGGILCHQNTFYDWETATQDDIYNKYALDQSEEGAPVIMQRRSSEHNKMFQIIGDIPLNDYILSIALNMGFTKLYGDAEATEQSYLYHMFDPVSVLGFNMSKTEDEKEKLSNIPQDAMTGCYHNEKPMSGCESWVDDAGYDPGTTEIEFPVSVDYNKRIYYEGRGSDPYKKLKHTVVCINNLDYIIIQRALSSCFLNTSKKEEIQVSAVEEDKDKIDDKKLDDEKEVSAMVGEGDDKKDEEQQVSATAEKKKAEVDKKKKIADEKKKKADKVIKDKEVKAKKKDDAAKKVAAAKKKKEEKKE